jgi:hypothetical protein
MVVITFTVIAVAGLLASLGVERLLRGHLRRVLVDLCESEARTGFWVAVTGLSIALTGLLAATSTLGYADAQVGGFDLFLGALTQARVLVFGLLGIVLVLAMFLLSSIRRFESRARAVGRGGWPPSAVAARGAGDAAAPPPPAP